MAGRDGENRIPADRQTDGDISSFKIHLSSPLPGSKAATDGMKFERQLDFINPSAPARLFVARRSPDELIAARFAIGKSGAISRFTTTFSVPAG